MAVSVKSTVKKEKKKGIEFGETATAPEIPSIGAKKKTSEEQAAAAEQMRAVYVLSRGGTPEDMVREGGKPESLKAALNLGEVQKKKEIEAISGQMEQLTEETNLEQEQQIKAEQMNPLLHPINFIKAGLEAETPEERAMVSTHGIRASLGLAGAGLLGAGASALIGGGATAATAGGVLKSGTVKSILSTSKLANAFFGVSLLGWVREIAGDFMKDAVGVNSSQQALVNSATDLTNIKFQLDLGGNPDDILSQLQGVESNLIILDKGLHNANLISEVFYEKEGLKQRRDGRDLRKDILVMRQAVLQSQFNQMRGNRNAVQ